MAKPSRLVIPMEPDEHKRVMDWFAQVRRTMTVEVRRILDAYLQSEKVRTAVDEFHAKKK